MATRSAFRFVSRAVAAMLLLAVLLAGGGLYWLGTQHALEWFARQAVTATEGRLALDGVQGSLYGRISISRAAFKDDGLEIEARTIVLEWRPQALLRREARITALTIDDLRITPTPADPEKPLLIPATLQLPLNATIADARIKRMEIVPGQVVQDLHFRLNARTNAHTLEVVSIETMGWRAAGTLRLDAAAPFAAAGQFKLAGKARGEPLKVGVTVGGKLEALEVQASSSVHGASAKAESLLRPFARLPLEKFTLNAENIDLAAWDNALPRTKIVIALEAAMPAPAQFAGTVRAKNEVPGPFDAQRVPLARAALSFAGNGTHWTFSDIDLGIGKSGRVHGSGSVENAGARLELTLADIVTAELHGRLQPLTVSGQAAITGDAGAQRLTAKLEGAGAKLELAARHAQKVITVERGELRAADGRLDFTGRAALTGNREFSANAEFSGLDPARFIAAPAARLNGKVSAEGTLTPDWRAQVRLAVTNSRFRGQPLAANAEFTSSAKQLFSGEARAVLGGNRLDVSGRFGEPDDKLKWSLDAANLKAVDATLSGSVQAQGTLAGSIAQPSVDFKLTARKFAAGGFGAGAMDAQGTMNAGADGTVRLTARATGIMARSIILDELTLDAQGTRLRHDITATLRGKNIDGSLSATGGLDESWRWNGNLAALEARGRIPFRLTAPARVSAGRGLLVLEDFQASALDGE
ncbi:MAG: hypothetical protein Q8L40_04350, partial [Burkholderiales bacterium]|nr:hypothetical protein [Burkholderiales bacterium]